MGVLLAIASRLALLELPHRRGVAHLERAVGDVPEQVQAGDPLALQQVDGVGVALAIEGDQDVAAVDLLLAARLHLQRRALQHPLERLGVLGFPVRPAGERRLGLVQVLLELAAQLGQPGAARAQDAGRHRIAEQGIEQVLQRDVLVAPRLGFREGQAQGGLQLLGDAERHL